MQARTWSYPIALPRLYKRWKNKFEVSPPSRVTLNPLTLYFPWSLGIISGFPTDLLLQEAWACHPTPTKWHPKCSTSWQCPDDHRPAPRSCTSFRSLFFCSESTSGGCWPASPLRQPQNMHMKDDWEEPQISRQHRKADSFSTEHMAVNELEIHTTPSEWNYVSISLKC